jgi:hypothetical protein
VEVAHLFYGGFRPKAGGLELLATAALSLVDELEIASDRKPPARPTSKPRPTTATSA